MDCQKVIDVALNEVGYLEKRTNTNLDSKTANAGYGNYTYQNPSVEFKKKYEESCNLLGVGYDADKYEIKLAYRKKAKEYHPDINKSSNATEMFQKVSDAYEFLNDDNIERYKKL